MLNFSQAAIQKKKKTAFGAFLYFLSLTFDPVLNDEKHRLSGSERECKFFLKHFNFRNDK
jgi:hypothetical protein